MEKEWRKKEFHDYYRINRMYCGRPRVPALERVLRTFCAAVVSPMLITFLHMPAYQAIGIALASDVLASGVSAWTYKKNKNIDIRHGVIMLISVLIFTLVRKLRFLPCAKRNNGRIFKRYDTACRTQIYYSPDHDNEGSAGKQIRGTENPAVHSLRRVNWLYLRFCSVPAAV